MATAGVAQIHPFCENTGLGTFSGSARPAFMLTRRPTADPLSSAEPVSRENIAASRSHPLNLARKYHLYIRMTM